MHVTRIGLTPLKGARHAERESVRLDETGPVGDRVFCLVEPGGDRVLRTVDHPQLVLVEAAWDGRVLALRTPEGREVAAPPLPTGEHLTRDYWGREAHLELVDSPHGRLLSDHLGREVRLARVSRPGEVVYGAPISLVTTGELADLGESDSARFRATFTVDAEHAPAPGAEMRLGEAVVRVRASIPRCRVIDIDPAAGAMDTRHLTTLASRPHPRGELPFGVDADVLVPGTVSVGDTVRVGAQTSVVPS